MNTSPQAEVRWMSAKAAITINRPREGYSLEESRPRHSRRRAPLRLAEPA